MVIHLHNHLNYFTGLKYVAKNLLCRFVFRKVTCICVSEDIAENVSQNTFLPKNRIYAVQNSIDFNRLSANEKSDLIGGNDFKMLIMATYGHAYRKGVDIAGKAVELLVNDNKKNVKLYVVSNNDIPEQLLAGVVPREIINNYIMFIPATDKIYEYFNSCDVMLALSREEGFPTSITEAAWCGEEIIATKCIGQRCNRTPNIMWVSDPTKIPFDEMTCEVSKAITNLMNVDKKKDFEELKSKQGLIESIYSLELWGRQIIHILENA